MNSVSRKLTLGMIVALGAAACGDDVTVTEQTPPPAPTPVVRSVVVSPSAATIALPGAFTFGAAVDADAGLATTVNWTSSNAAVATVANGVATAVGAGVTSVCATSTVDANKASCAQLTVTAAPAPQPATVEIDAVTIGCDAIARALSPAANCNLNAPVATNNVFGEFQVQANVNRPQGSAVTGVRLEVINAATGIVEATQTQTLSQDAMIVEGLAAQAAANRVTFSVQSAAYSLTNGAVTHVNGQKRIRVSLVGNNATASADRELTFRNANGFHITGTTIPTTNAAGSASQQALAGVQWTGGVPLTFTAIPVSYTGVAANMTTLTLTFGNVGCDLSGTGPRAAAAPTGTVTMGYTSAVTPAPGNLNAYEFNAGACAAANPLGEIPTANAVDANGNPFVNIALGGNFGATNTLNNPAGPVVPGTIAQTAPGYRLDNRAPTGAFVTNVNPGNRANGWLNDAVTFNTVGAATSNSMVLTGHTMVDGGIGGVAFRAKVGTTLANTITAADISNPTTLAPTATNVTHCLVQYVVDAFGNRTANPGACNTTFGVDRAAPTVSFTAGSLAANARLSGATIGGEFIVTLLDTGLVGNSGMAPTNPMVGSIVRRNQAAAVTCILGTGATCATQAALAGAPPIMNTAIAATAGTPAATDVDHGYYTFNGTARDAAGNTTVIGPRVILYDMSAPVVAVAGLPATVTASGYTATSFVSEDVDVMSQWFSVGYAGAPAALTPALIGQAQTQLNGFNAAVLTAANTPISQVISLPLAIQSNMDPVTLTGQSTVNANAFNQASVLGVGATAAPVLTLPGAMAIPASWTAYTNPAAPVGVTGITAGVSAGNAANPTSTTLSVTTTGATAIFNNPFTRVDFYAVDQTGTEFRFIGTAGAATLTDNGLVRTFTYNATISGAAVGQALFTATPPAAGTSYASSVIALGYGASNNVAMITAAGLAFNIRN